MRNECRVNLRTHTNLPPDSSWYYKDVITSFFKDHISFNLPAMCWASRMPRWMGGSWVVCITLLLLSMITSASTCQLCAGHPKFPANIIYPGLSMFRPSWMPRLLLTKRYILHTTHTTHPTHTTPFHLSQPHWSSIHPIYDILNLNLGSKSIYKVQNPLITLSLSL